MSYTRGTNTWSQQNDEVTERERLDMEMQSQEGALQVNGVQSSTESPS